MVRLCVRQSIEIVYGKEDRGSMEHAREDREREKQRGDGERGRRDVESEGRPLTT